MIIGYFLIQSCHQYLYPFATMVEKNILKSVRDAMLNYLVNLSSAPSDSKHLQDGRG